MNPSNDSDDRDVVIYVPAYNCERTILSMLQRIPDELLARSRIMVIDNQSEDRTSRTVKLAYDAGLVDAPLTLLKTKTNLGYAGSQKLAYRLVRQDPKVAWIMMLHGDGQYPPELLPNLLRAATPQTALVYGYRSKVRYFRSEQTPWTTWSVIKGLSLIESIYTGQFRREWHTGFVMYSTEFLRQIDFDKITSTPHIDGHLQFVAGALDQKVKAVPIFKLYRDLTAFEGAERRSYVLNLYKLMRGFVESRDDLRNHPYRAPSSEDLSDQYEELLGTTPVERI